MKSDVARVRAALLDHYDRHRRDLPWRRSRDPYAILVSEVMLQQTRVDTVSGYYERWMRRFPDVDALAGADEQDVLKAWEGLGYYRRARNLHAAARVVREQWGGDVPAGVDRLRSLPGVGEYTAGAVASIAFGHVAPAVDGNVRRVLSRWYDVAAPTASWLRDTAATLVDPDRPGDWNQALMELGATVCTPRTPRCEVCPVSGACEALAAGTIADRPGPTARRRPRNAFLVLAVLRAPEGSVLVERRPDTGLLAGLWAFPERELETVGGAHPTPEQMREALVELYGASLADGAAPPPDTWRPLEPVRHRFTHIDATYLPWLIDAPRALPDGPDRRWVVPGSASGGAGAPALPVAQRMVMDQLA